MSLVTLVEINEDNWEGIARLSNKLSEQQQQYVAHNAISMLEQHYDPETLFQFGVYNGETPVGYVLYGIDEDTQAWWIIRLMIAPEQQGKGFGKAVMQQMIDIIKAKPDCDAIYICFVPENLPARKLYEQLGFVDTGIVEDGELVFRLAVN
jgi:diamine N-acetyltransferase